MIEFEMNSGTFYINTNQNTILKFKKFKNIALDMTIFVNYESGLLPFNFFKI